MSTTDGWDLTIPEDAAELLAELRRHGVQPGEQVRVSRSVQGRPVSRNAITGRYVSRTSQGASRSTPPEKSGEHPRRTLRFAGSIQAEPDLSERTDEYLGRGFGTA